MQTDLLVIGGGVAGLSAALSAANSRVRVAVVEKEDRVGGFAAQFCCKATDRCAFCGSCVADELVREAQSKEGIDFLLSTTVSSFSRQDGVFSVALEDGAEVSAGAVVLATGFDPFDPAAQRNATMLGRHPDILSALEIERMLREDGRITRRSDHATPRKVAFIQCVGSRSRRFGSSECSRVCCPYAVRIARRMKWQQPDSEVSIFHMDLQGIRKVAQDMYGEFAEELNLIRGIPSDALAEADGTITLKYELTDSGDIARGSYEMVVLSVGICPNRETQSLGEAFGVELDELGFMRPISVLEPNVSTVEGVFMAGTCSGPRDIRESIAHGKAAAYAALEWIKRKDS